MPTRELAKFLVSTKQSNGFKALVDLIYNGAAATSEFDEFGHLLRTLVTIVDCAEYRLSPKSGCSANFTGLRRGRIVGFRRGGDRCADIEEEVAEAERRHRRRHVLGRPAAPDPRARHRRRPAAGR